MSRRILVIDDDPSIKIIIETLLRKEGFELRSAYDGEEALRALPHFKPNLIICDVQMPQMDGFEFLQKVRSNPRYYDIPFIFLSIHTRREEIDRGIALGADSYLTKPIDPTQLTTTVKTVFRLLEKSNPSTKLDIEQSSSNHVGSGFRGNIGAVSVTQALQLLEMGEKTGVMRLFFEEGEGAFHLRKGIVTAVERYQYDNEMVGLDAAFELFALESGAFEFDASAEPYDDGTNEKVSNIVLQWLVRLDHEDNALDDSSSDFPTDSSGAHV